MLSATITSSTQRAAAMTTSRRAITTGAIKATVTCCLSSLASSGMASFPRQQRRSKSSAVPDHSQRHAATSASSSGYNFASMGYADCFRDLPKPNTDALRASALAYLEKFDQKKWYDEPVSCPLFALYICQYISKSQKNKRINTINHCMIPVTRR